MKFVSPSEFVSSSLCGIGTLFRGALLRFSAFSADSICSASNLPGLLDFISASSLAGCSAHVRVLGEGSSRSERFEGLTSAIAPFFLNVDIAGNVYDIPSTSLPRLLYVEWRIHAAHVVEVLHGAAPLPI